MSNIVHRIKNAIERDNKKLYVGRIEKIDPTNLKPGVIILTPRGLGTVRGVQPDSWLGTRPEKVAVRLYNRYWRLFNIKDTTQFAVFHEPSQQLILLSFQHYRYINENQQTIRYRVTHRNYAFLSDSCQRENHLHYLMNRRRDGPNTLKVLQNNGYTIKKDKTLLQLLLNR